MRLLLLNDPLTEPAVVPDGRLLQPRPHHQHRPQPQERGGLQPGLSVQGPVVGVSAGDHQDQEADLEELGAVKFKRLQLRGSFLKTLILRRVK